jgi:hypothetical protein
MTQEQVKDLLSGPIGIPRVGAIATEPPTPVITAHELALDLKTALALIPLHHAHGPDSSLLDHHRQRLDAIIRDIEKAQATVEECERMESNHG